MLVAILLIILVVLVIYLLLMPIILSIDTQNNEYYIQLKGLAKAYIEPHEEAILRIKLKVFFMKFYINPIDEYYKHKNKKKLNSANQKTAKKKSKKRISPYKGFKLIKTFKVKRFYINLDTGNVITNAKLFPVFECLDYYKGGFHINFQGHNQLAVRLQNRPINIIKVLIQP